MNFDFSKKARLGSGAYGTVYETIIGEKKIAVKRIRTNRKYAWNEQNAIRELIAAFSIPPHSNILPIFGSYCENGNAFFIFPKLVCNVYQKLKNESPTADMILKWSFQLISGVSHMHENGFFHRDIKMENLLLNEDNDLLIGDFGMTRCFTDKNTKLSGRVCSSWTRPPELKFEKYHKYDDRFDSWSVGCVLIAMAAGKYVFRSNEKKSTLSSILEIMGGSKLFPEFPVKTEVIQIDTLRSFCKKELPTYFFSVVVKLLQTDPNKRSRVRDVKTIFPHTQNPLKVYEALSFEHENYITSKNEIKIHYESKSKKNIGDWIWRICKKFHLSEITALHSLLCFLRCTNHTILFASASCSLISRINESICVSTQIWSKSIGCKVKNLESSEIQILKDLGGKLILNISTLSIPCMFLLLCTTDLTLEKINLIANENFLNNEFWKNGHLEFPHIK